jgi:putative copper export protein
MDLSSQHEFLAQAIVVLSRALIYMCTFAGIGGLAWEFMQKRTKMPLQENTSTLYKIALGGGILATMTHFWYLGVTALPVREKTQIFDFVFSSAGLSAAFRICGFACLYPLENPFKHLRHLRVFGIFLLTLSYGVISHSSTHLTGINRFIFTVLLSLHIIFASAWFAGMMDLFMSFRNADELSRRAKVFSRMSKLVFSTALLCGLGLATFFVQNNTTLKTLYEQILTTKFIVVCLIILMATLQRWILLPRIQHTPERALPYFNRGIQLQLLCACLVFLLTAVLVTQAPP